MRTRLVFLFLAFTLFIISCQRNTPDMFARDVFNYIQNGNEPEDLCINKEEFINLIENVENINVSEIQIENIIDNWEMDKSKYFRNFYWAGNPTIDNKTIIDSITYGYLIPKSSEDTAQVWPDGFNWPDSKKHKVDSEKLTISFITIYFNDISGSYYLSFDAIYLHPYWKLYHLGGRMYINEIK